MLIDRASLKEITDIAEKTCFGCGQNNPIGLHMKIYVGKERDEERLYCFHRTAPTMGGWDRTVHGGILSVMMDEIMGWSAIYLLRKVGVTQSMQLDFLKPTFVETELSIVGSVHAIRSERQAVLCAEIYNATNELCARATANFATMSAKTAVRLGLVGADYVARFAPVLERL